MKNKGEILTRLLEKYCDCVVFLHNTREKRIADQILKEGFQFENQLAHSSDRVNPKDHVEVTYFLFQRKEYGSFTVIICIPSKTYSGYAAVAHEKGTLIEDILTIKDPAISDNDEYVYLLPPQHILGFLNLSNGEFTR